MVCFATGFYYFSATQLFKCLGRQSTNFWSLEFCAILFDIWVLLLTFRDVVVFCALQHKAHFNGGQIWTVCRQVPAHCFKTAECVFVSCWINGHPRKDAAGLQQVVHKTVCAFQHQWCVTDDSYLYHGPTNTPPYNHRCWMFLFFFSLKDKTWFSSKATTKTVKT